jgi:hypothetical protein
MESRDRMPTSAQFLTEARGYLQQQKTRIIREEGPQGGQELEHFAIESEANNQRTLLDYYIVRQAQGGATLAARLLSADVATLRKEVDGIARSVVVIHAPVESNAR